MLLALGIDARHSMAPIDLLIAPILALPVVESRTQGMNSNSLCEVVGSSEKQRKHCGRTRLDPVKLNVEGFVSLHIVS